MKSAHAAQIVNSTKLFKKEKDYNVNQNLQKIQEDF